MYVAKSTISVRYACFDRAVMRITACLSLYIFLLFFQVGAGRSFLNYWINTANSYKRISITSKKLSLVKSPETTATNINQINEKFSYYLKYLILVFQNQKYIVKVIRIMCTRIHLFYS